jgi:hypothetical protein
MATFTALNLTAFSHFIPSIDYIFIYIFFLRLPRFVPPPSLPICHHRYSNGEYCEKALPRHLQWQYDAFCADSPQFLHEFNPPFYELNPDTHRPFANLLRMRSAKV